MAWISMHSPVGDLTIHEQDNQLVSLDWGWAPDCPDTPSAVLAEAQHQLNTYFDGARTGFDLPTAPQGTPFQKSVWATMAKIPYGETQTYGQLAQSLQSAPRAIGAACGANPIPIILPCHRVLGAKGTLNGYSGGEGISTKADLLTLEGNTDFQL